MIGKSFLEWPPRIEDHTFLPAFFQPEPTVIDLGVNQGGFAMPMIRRYNAKVYGAEPVTQLFKKLPKHERLFIIHAAITGTNKSVNIYQRPDYCASLIKDKRATSLKTEKVAGLTLDTFLKRFFITKVDLAKIDIEGAEVEMFTNASTTSLRKIDQYTIEFHDFLFPNLLPKVNKIIKMMEGLGFVCIKFSTDNTNVVFIKREILSRVGEFWLRGPVRFGQGGMRLLRRYFKSNLQMHRV